MIRNIFYEEQLEQASAWIKDAEIILIGAGAGASAAAGLTYSGEPIIRFPFERMVREKRNLSLIRLNRDEAVVPDSLGSRAIGIGGDMAQVISDLNGQNCIRGKGGACDEGS